MKAPAETELVWKALAQPVRREILDVLAGGPRTTGELIERFPALCRTAVMKHLDLLEEARLVLVRRAGRVRWNHLNPVPIQRVCDRWVQKHVRNVGRAMSRLKDHVEAAERSGPRRPKNPSRGPR